MSTSLSLSVKVPTDSLKRIASALPSSLANNVISSQVEQVFVWIIKDSESAAKIVSILRDSGFKNIKLDSKGTTITALAGGLINNTSSTTNTSTSGDATADATTCPSGYCPSENGGCYLPECTGSCDC
jgi:predicted transcriptional regulator